MTNPKRPRRQRKADRLLNPDSTVQQIECDYGIAPMDRLATELDRKWGIDRLPELVSVETAQKYGRAMAHLNDCIKENDPAKCAAAAQNCIKGLNVMDAEATAASKPQADGSYWEYEVPAIGGGQPLKFGILQDGAEWQTAKAARPDLVFFTMREVGIALQQKLATPLVMETKKQFPGAEVRKVTSTQKREPVNYAAGGDPMPF